MKRDFKLKLIPEKPNIFDNIYRIFLNDYKGEYMSRYMCNKEIDTVYKLIRRDLSFDLKTKDYLYHLPCIVRK